MNKFFILDNIIKVEKKTQTATWEIALLLMVKRDHRVESFELSLTLC